MKALLKQDSLKQTLFSLLLVFLPQFVLSQELITGELDTGGHRTASLGELVIVSSENSQVENRSSLNYIWSFISKPEGSKALLFSTDELKTFFVPDTKGTYILRLYIYGGGFISESKDTIVLVKEPKIRAFATAGEDLSVRPGALVDLSAGESYHFGNEEGLSYEWVLESIPAKSSAQIYFPNSKETSFYADEEGIYLVRLIVYSENSQMSLPSYKVVRAEGANINAPTASAGQDRAVLTGEDLTLMGSVAYTGSEALTYEWEIVSFPFENSAHLTNSESLTPVFRASANGTYILSFKAKAGGLSGAPDFVKIVSGEKPTALVLDSNIIALTDQEIFLDGSVSFDSNGLDLTHSWTVVQEPATSSVQFSDPLASKTSFSADKEGDYLLALVVRNPHFSSEPKNIKVRLISPASFKAEATANQVLNVGSDLSLSASSSLGTGLSYLWSLIEKPDLSHTEILDNNFISSTIPIDKVGAYIFRLQVAKEGIPSDPDYVVFNSVRLAGSNVFNQVFRPERESLTLPISECEENTASFNVTQPQNKEYFIVFENQGVEEFFVLLNGEALTGRLEQGDETSVYSVSLSETNSLSVRLRGLKTNSLKLQIIEKSSSQSFPTPPSLTAGSINVSLGASETVFVRGESGLTYSVLKNPVYGQAVVNSSGQVTYTSSGVSAKKDLILIKAVDSSGLASVIPIKVTIN